MLRHDTLSKIKRAANQTTGYASPFFKKIGSGDTQNRMYKCFVYDSVYL